VNNIIEKLLIVLYNRRDYIEKLKNKPIEQKTKKYEFYEGKLEAYDEIIYLIAQRKNEGTQEIED
jgi:small nuclear ribonucleoprotein (snRNP)-like protein